MLAGHADEIAMAVNYIDEDGFIYVRKMGGVDRRHHQSPARGSSTRATGRVKGVVGNVAPHLTKEDKDRKPAENSRTVHRHRRQEP